MENSTILAADASDEARILRAEAEVARAALAFAAGDKRYSRQDSIHGLVCIDRSGTSIPEQLMTCKHLDSDQKILWGLLRRQVYNRTGVAPKQSYFSKIMGISQSTVSTKMAGLRIHRWLTRYAVVKSESSGHYCGVIDVIHLKPATIQDTLYLNPNYIYWLESLAQKKSTNYKALRKSATSMLQQLDNEVPQDIETRSNLMVSGYGLRSFLFG